MALARRKAPQALLGSPLPRIGPPRPLRHDLEKYRETAKGLGIIPMPWQETATSYITAKGPDDHYAYREVAIVVGRQNGKTTLTKPIILERLKAGRHIMHIAQVRELPRIMFETIADALEATDPDLFPRRRGKIIWPRRGAGSESIILANGGSYRIAAALSGSARGHSIDDLVIDELREMDSFDVINSAKPAQRFSDDPQTIYLSNAGDEHAVVLDSLRKRGEAGDPSLAYLEWSADPEYLANDRRGWLQANPAIGHYEQVLRDLEKDYTAAELGGNMAGFETESLCRSMPSLKSLLLPDGLYDMQQFVDQVPRPVTSHMAIKLDAENERVSAVVSWVDQDGAVIVDVHDSQSAPESARAQVGEDLKRIASENRAWEVGFDPYTDGSLIPYLPRSKPLPTHQYAVASEWFVKVAKEHRLRIHDPADVLRGDLMRTVRKASQSGTYIAARAGKDPNTAAEAAVRAVWLASKTLPTKLARID